MGWISPEQCTSNCCGPPTPCPPPIVTCRLYVDGYGGGSGFLAYTVENADSAWVRQNCGGVITDFALTLTSGAASGNYSPINDEDCTYSIFAENSCATVVATCECDVPYCELSAERVVNGTTGLFESVRLRWRYRSLPPSTPLLGNPIVAADLNGLDVLGAPYEDTGDEFVLEPFDLTESYTLTITNDCGEETTCTVFIPCCWRQSAAVVQISGVTDLTDSCADTTVAFVPRAIDVIRVFNREQFYEITGLTSLNATHIINVQKFNCLAFAPFDDILLGTVTVRGTSRTDYEVFAGPLAGLHFVETEYEATYDVYLSYLLGVRNIIADGEINVTETYSEFAALDFSGVVCKGVGGSGNWITPPCANAPLDYDSPVATFAANAGCGSTHEIPPNNGRIERDLVIEATSEMIQPLLWGGCAMTLGGVFTNAIRSEWL